MQYTVLGPVGIRSHDVFHAAGTAKEQGVLAILLMERGHSVSTQTLADRLWERPPEQFRATLQAHISRLRRRLREASEQAEVIASNQAGYRIDVPADQVDVHYFDLLVSRAQAHAGQDPDSARELLREAEGLWNGEPLAGLPGTWAETMRRVLTDKRRTALLKRLELDLQTGGNADDAVAELTELASGSRIDQRVIELLMIALDSAGRPGDALTLYHEVRIRLRDEAGTDPRAELRQLHQRLLNGSAQHPAAAAPAQPVTPRAIDTLDPDPPYVAGREQELAAILAAVAADLRPGKRGATFLIDGLAGIGKTTLALQAAHLLRSHCPDGALQLNLHSHDPYLPPLDQRQALTQLLDAIGTPYRELARADTVPALGALWRKRTSGRRLLILLDDVLDTAQIELLIPATAGTIVLITSRRRLTGTPGNRQYTLGPLPDSAATALLSHITDRTLPEDDDLASFTQCCGGLALAITVAAGHLRSRPVWTVGDLVSRLSTTSQSLADDPLTSPIHTAFAMSYQTLSPTLRDLLRYIAAHPGPDIGLPAAAAMSGAALADTDIRLDALVDHRLLNLASAHRYRLHNLLRQYILVQGDEQQNLDNRQAVGRAITFYKAAAARADHALQPRRRELHYPAASAQVEGVNLDTTEQARTWLDTEHLNLAAVTTWSVQLGRGIQVGLIPHVLAQHLDRRGRWPQALEHIDELLAAPKGDFPGGNPDAVTACLLTDQAGLLIRANQLDVAVDAANAALAIWNAANDRYGQADAHFQIGRAHDAAERHDEALQAFRTAAALYESLGDHTRVAVAEDQWAVTAFKQGHLDEAFSRGHHALDIARQQNDLAAIADVLNNLGEMHRQADHDQEALAFFQEARTLTAALGDPLITAVLGYNIGAVYEHAGDYHRSLTSTRTALLQFRELNDHRSEIECLILLATAHINLGDRNAAFEETRHAIDLAEQTHDQLRLAQVRLAQGTMLAARGDIQGAIEACESALDIAEQIGAVAEQSQAHRSRCEAYTSLGLHDRAQSHLQQAESQGGPTTE
ncbi:transcriptional regulator, SARP family [Catenulispora acidiphila DSM 44928]|uniref:Transcriptional regulator, SARP family n=1 Tax=Catenulispora acidiphila (strain DSM 44928 / JCM 14897 / NBRC 102108 / NRRL B-24433 / ID139908) TaxID=479433 RepID=C7QFS4_CATAD|nr:BTAD domain-containing putative transcriptional regulator [Catenulispora acidiphila]ACU70901.1 transcriptional regulator, SARP family [Catenulispora acidiphila DSM 44928]